MENILHYLNYRIILKRVNKIFIFNTNTNINAQYHQALTLQSLQLNNKEFWLIQLSLVMRLINVYVTVNFLNTNLLKPVYFSNLLESFFADSILRIKSPMYRPSLSFLFIGIFETLVSIFVFVLCSKIHNSTQIKIWNSFIYKSPKLVIFVIKSQIKENATIFSKFLILKSI
ncbi:hypothetical protein BpHYR1_028140 [Brachionus plicatilis]|uniref:Transmembrane protein n=1 Tax=Brachionus plicatilis TaxID=10195 RepID=A0A3M7PN36_BRAPC|nr:hypothetical protein BpHYR1_028140 [Brachionus plicatilis]